MYTYTVISIILGLQNLLMSVLNNKKILFIFLSRIKQINLLLIIINKHDGIIYLFKDARIFINTFMNHNE